MLWGLRGLGGFKVSGVGDSKGVENGFMASNKTLGNEELRGFKCLRSLRVLGFYSFGGMRGHSDRVFGSEEFGGLGA